MRRELLRILKCPSCKKGNLVLYDELEEELEIRYGTLICETCGQRFPINEGVAELLTALDENTLQERLIRDKIVRDWDVERQRPYINDNPSSPWVWPSIAANVEQGLNQVNLSNALALDIGAATCWSTRMICERGAKSIALDISSSMLRDGEAQFSTGVFFDRIAATMNELPFKDETFDVIFSSATIHHSADIHRTLYEISRVLKPNGNSVLVNEPVLGWLNRSSQFGLEEIELGMNEHIYRAKDYLLATEYARLKTQVLIPASIELQLCGEIPVPETLIMKSSQRIWKWLPRKLQDSSLRLGNFSFGLPLVMIAQKPND